MRKFASLCVGLACAAAPTSSWAAAPSELHGAPGEGEAERDRFRFGVLGAVGFPRLIAVEPAVKLRGLVTLGAEYGALPTVTLSGVDTSMWSLAGSVRLFPFKDPFFVGLRGGYQHLAASTIVAVAPYGSLPESATLDTWFLNPRAGFLWTLRGGFSIGMDAGVQIPVASSFATTVPAALAPNVESSPVVKVLGGVLPTVDLLRMGFLL